MKAMSYQTDVPALPTAGGFPQDPDRAERRRRRQAEGSVVFRNVVNTGNHKSAPGTHPHPHMCTHHTYTHVHTRQALGPTSNTAEIQQGQGLAYGKRLRAPPRPQPPSRGPQLNCPVTGWQAGAWPSHTLQN